ncbi:MAG: efflux RND transporter permease subunit [Elusimicrobia bacterium]|nr:efflux RND transporter permease subunit [Elusimicrobiota bacterium]
MLNKIIDSSVENKFAVIIFFIFLTLLGLKVLKDIPVDAIPDLSDTQVIVYSKWNKSPKVIEDQITYPVITSLLGTPKVKTIRGFSDYGYSFIYVIFEDKTDIYWARSRVLEYLDKIKSQLPKDAQINLGPDATGVGWIFQYALIDKTGKMSAQEIRSYHDFNLKYKLQSVEGVSEIASVGGFEKEYQIIIDPNKLFIYKISVQDIINALKNSNNESDARIIEYSGFEYMVKVNGYLKGEEDIKNIVLKSANGIPVKLADAASIKIGPQIRRGTGDFNGHMDTVSGIVVARHNENALKVIERIKDRINDIKKTLPYGMEIVTVYDRSDLIKRALGTLKKQLKEEILIVSFIILLFLWHIPSALTAIITIPISILFCFLFMYMLGINSNIMSISGIAISIGVLVDGAIIEVENAYKKLEIWNENGRKEDFREIRLKAIKEVAPSVFFSLLVISVSFIPIFALTDHEGKLFSPLAWTKTLAMISAAFLALTLDPAVRMSFSRKDYFNIKPNFISSILNSIFIGKYYKEEEHPVSKILFKLYTPVCGFVLKNPKKTVLTAILSLFATLPIFFKLGGEFMPPLNEGSLLYMPTTLTGISVEEARKILNVQNKILKSFPEVLTVYGKAGRASTATDPAPLSMIETVIVLKPQEEWRNVKRWYSNWSPEYLKKILRRIWYDKITYKELIKEMDKALKLPGFVNAWTMPIKGRIDMLSTGIRTPLGIKIIGPDLEKTQEIAVKIENSIKDFPKIRSVYAERTGEGYFIEIEPLRDNLNKYNLTITDFQEVISNTIGAMPITYTVEGRERYPITLRYKKDSREDLSDIKNALITVNQNIQIPLRELAKVNFTKGPSMIRDENGFYASYVYVDFDEKDIGGYIEKIKKHIDDNFSIPQGYSIFYGGQYENMIRVKERMKIILPVTIFAIFLLIYINTKGLFKTFLVMSAVPFSLIGAFWFIYLLDYNLSVAVWVGIIALAGLDAETGIFMLLYLDLAYEDMKSKKNFLSDEDIKESVYHGAVKRVRPKMMTVAAAFMGLIPIMWSLGTGSDVMKRIAAPMIGGLFTSFIFELTIYPAAYYLYLKKTNNNRLR